MHLSHPRFKAISALLVYIAAVSAQIQPDDCASWITAELGDTCESLAGMFSNLTPQNLLDWNPSLNSNCDNMKPSESYCVAIKEGVIPPPPQPTTAPVPAPTTAPVPAPTNPPKPPSNGDPNIISTRPGGISDSGQPSHCSGWYKVLAGDNCNVIVQKIRGLTRGHLMGWNPALGPDCSGLALNGFLCVKADEVPRGISVPDPVSPPITTPTKPPPPPLSNPSGVVTSKPSKDTLSGQPSTCSAWYKVQAKDTCGTVLESLKAIKELTRGHLLGWNPPLGPYCGGLKANTFLCVKAALPSKGK